VTAETSEKVEISDTSVERSAEEPLRRKVIRGISWELAGQFGTQLWRFASNLILTRLLAPEAFGLIGIVQVFMMAITLFSDIGLQSSVIHDRRGEERRFLDTVWTVSVIRGLIMWLVTCLLAGPSAALFDMPELVWLLPITGLSSILRGFASTSLLTASRNLRNDWYVLVESGSQVIGTTFTVVLAFWLRSVSALAWGWTITAAAYTLLSFARRDVPWNRFCWDREIARSLSRFGRWALVSGGLTILQQRGDRLGLVKVISTAQLGAYVIGSNLALLPMTVFMRLNSAVGQPLYARVRDLPAASARSKIRRLRLGIVLTHMPVMVLLVIFGKPLVDLMYPAKYELAGWYCSLASLAGLVRIGSDLGPINLAHGDSWTHLKIMVVRTISLIFSMAAGYFVGSVWGTPGDGLLYGIVVSPLLAYPYQAGVYQRLNAWLPEVDMLALIPACLLMVGQILRVF
jgi:O-antigen/teichoic acid export membrane protein